MSVNDLAGSAVYGGNTPEQLLAGDQDIKTSNGIATGVKAKYQIAARLADGTIVDFVGGTNTAAQAVLVMQPCGSGSPCQIAYHGTFNDDLLAVQPANAALYAHASANTLAKRLGFFNGLFRVGKITPAV